MLAPGNQDHQSPQLHKSQCQSPSNLCHRGFAPRVWPLCQSCCREFTAHSCTSPAPRLTKKPAPSVGLGNATRHACAIHSSPMDNGTNGWASPALTLTTNSQTTFLHHLQVRRRSCAQTELHSPSTISTCPPRSRNIVFPEGAPKKSRRPPPCSMASVRHSAFVSHPSSNRHGAVVAASS